MITIPLGKEISVTDTSTNSPLTYDWDFGDGTVMYGTSDKTLNHTYSTKGLYTLKHKSYNPCGSSTECSKDVSVTTTQSGAGVNPIVLVGALALTILGISMIKKK